MSATSSTQTSVPEGYCAAAQQGTYIPNPSKIRVGYGYRLLAQGERERKSDDFLCDGIWTPHVEWSEGVPVGPCHVPHRRKIEPEPGYEAVPENEQPGTGARFMRFHCWWMSKWNDTTSMCPPSKWGNRDYDGLLVTRPIRKTDTLDAQIVRAREHLAALEQERKECDEIKVGDWVVFMYDGRDTIHKTTAAHQNGIFHSAWGSLCFVLDPPPDMGGLQSSSAHRIYLRKATPAEIAAHLAAHEVRVNGYAAVFYPRYVQFGCARIDNRLIRSAYAFVRTARGGMSYGNRGNRTGDSVKIGAGVFDHDTLAKLVKQLKD